jgi:hypothetical protein
MGRRFVFSTEIIGPEALHTAIAVFTEASPQFSIRRRRHGGLLEQDASEDPSSENT